MPFLQPLFLLALPLIGLPILIHLLNQRRHKTAPWAARSFVLEASSLNRGMAVVRHWIILALRALAIAAIIFVIARPLASRIPGLGSLGSPRTQIILVDRSPSMALRNSETGLTWRDASLAQLEDHLETVGGRQLLFHDLSDEPVVVGKGQLDDLLETQITATQTNLPSLIERALSHVKDQSVGPSDLWVLTDRQTGDWRLESGRWNRIREKIEEMTDVKLRFLTPEDRNDDFNLAASVENVRLVKKEDRHFVYLDFKIVQTSGEVRQRKIPIRILASGTERTLDIEMNSSEFRYQQLEIEIPSTMTANGGVIEIPLDSNEADNRYYFAFSPEPARRSVILSDHEEVSALLDAVCSTPLESSQVISCEVIPVSQQNEIDWQNTALIVWHAPLPQGDTAQQVEQFISGGGTVMFLPDESEDPTEFAGVSWGEWTEASEAQNRSKDDDRITQWRTENDLLATDESGNRLPVDSITCSRRRAIETKTGVMLASFGDGQALLVRASTQNGGAYFLATSLEEEVSSFSKNGVVLYVMMQRALEEGAQSLAQSRQVEAGDSSLTDTELWEPLDLGATAEQMKADQMLVAADQRAYHAGVFTVPHSSEKNRSSSDSRKIIAVNRSLSEDFPSTVAKADVNELLGEDSFELITTSASSLKGLTNEIWKIFVIGMVLALIIEGWLSLPAKSGKSQSDESIGVNNA